MDFDIMYVMAKITVIVPIYKVEKFIARCANALFNQTLQDIEYIFVNDATPDDSIKILNEVLVDYPERIPQVRIINHEKNRGLPAARNTGLKHANGEYIYHCDSDDYIECTMLKTMYDTAIEHESDIVWSDWYLTFEEKERYMRQPYYTTAFDALKGMLSGQMKYNVWNKLARRALYSDNDIRFPEGYGMGEDMTMILLFAYAQKVTYIPQAFYHYVKYNYNAFSQTFSTEHLKSLKHNESYIENRLRQIYGDSIDIEIACFKLEIKFPFLIIGTNPSLYKLWKTTYPEANKYILKNHYVSTRSRIIQWCASKDLWFIVRVHYWIVCRFVYGIIYK
jgi:glycosyltransferase involved in cell wall biosynthesis